MKTQQIKHYLLLLAIVLFSACLQKENITILESEDNHALKSKSTETGEFFIVEPNGIDDTDNIRTALNNVIEAGPGSIVQLTEGTFYLSERIEVEGFDGFIKGAGKEKTIITNTPGVVIDFYDPVNPEAGLIKFRLGNIHMSDLTFSFSDPVLVGNLYLPNPDEFKGAMPYVIRITGNSLADPSSTEQFVSSTFDNVGFIGAQGNFNGYNVLKFVGIGAEWYPGWGSNPDYRLDEGVHKFTNCDFESSSFAIHIRGTTNKAECIIGGDPLSGNTFKNVGLGSLFTDNCASFVDISHNFMTEVKWGGIRIHQGYEVNSAWLSLSKVSIHNNVTNGYIAIWGESNDMHGTVIKNNKISAYNGIVLWGVNGVEVKKNVITGFDSPGIWVEWGGYGRPSIENKIINNTLESSFIYVGPHTFNNQFINNLVNGSSLEYLVEDYFKIYEWGWLPRPSKNFILAQKGDRIYNFNSCGEDICEQFDYDFDGSLNEDPVDQIDNDGDGLIDEDPEDFPNIILDVVGKSLENLTILENKSLILKNLENKRKVFDKKYNGFRDFK
jgi:hypothetical protein